jgi:ACT domain-containing protein
MLNECVLQTGDEHVDEVGSPLETKGGNLSTIQHHRERRKKGVEPISD